MFKRFIELAAPLCACAFLFLPDARAHWLAVGLITSIAFWAAVETGFSASVAVLIGVALVRWIPLHDVAIWREVIVLLGVFAVLATSDALKPLATLAAISVAVVTPAAPARGLLFPFGIVLCNFVPAELRPVLSVIFAAAIPFARYSFAPMLVVAALVCAMPLLRFVPVLPEAAAVGLFALWPWSGLVARSFPALLRAEPRAEQRMAKTIVAPQSVSVDVPQGMHRAIVTMSAGRAERLWPGAVLGHFAIDGKTRDFAIGDIADFGFMRREHFLTAHNAPPRIPIRDVHDFGASAWLNGAGRVTIALPHDAHRLYVTAVRPGTTLLVESIEFE